MTIGIRLRNSSCDAVIARDIGLLMHKDRFAILIAFAALYLIWGSTYLGIALAIESIPPFLMAGTRFFSAGLIMYAMARITGAPPPQGITWRSAFIIGGCLLMGGNGAVTISEKWVPTGLASLIVATVPIDIALLGWLSGITPRPTTLVLMGLAGGFLGVGLLIGPALNAASNHLALGMIILLAGSLIWSAGSLYSLRAKSSPSLFLAAGQQMICGGVLLFLLGISLGETHRFAFQEVSSKSTFAFAYLVLIGALIGYTAYFWLLRHCDPSKVATYAYVNPVVAVILGVFFHGETLSWRVIIAAAAIISSVALVITAQQVKAKVSAATEPLSRENDETRILKSESMPE